MQLLDVALIQVRLNIENLNGKNYSDNDSILISGTSFHDLTNLIFEGMPTYPGEPKPEFSPHFRLKRDKVNVTRLTMSSHSGTHVDAPKHFIFNGQGIDSVSLNKFIGETVILDVSKKEVGHGVTDTELDIHEKMVKENDILLLYTGMSKDWNKNENRIKNFTYLEPTAAAWIVEHNIKCVGIDSCSMEKLGLKKDQHTKNCCLIVWESLKVSIQIFKNLLGPECFLFACHYCSKMWMALQLGQYCLVLKI